MGWTERNKEELVRVIFAFTYFTLPSVTPKSLPEYLPDSPPSLTSLAWSQRLLYCRGGRSHQGAWSLYSWIYELSWTYTPERKRGKCACLVIQMDKLRWKTDISQFYSLSCSMWFLFYQCTSVVPVRKLLCWLIHYWHTLFILYWKVSVVQEWGKKDRVSCRMLKNTWFQHSMASEVHY